MKIFTTILLICSTFYTSLAQKSNVDDVFQKVLEVALKTESQLAKYSIYNFDNEASTKGEWLSDYILYKDANSYYYKMDNYEFYQNEKASIWLDHDQKVAQYIPLDENQIQSKGEVNSSILMQQLQQIKDNCDSIKLLPSSSDKTIIAMYPQYGMYKKLVIEVNRQYLITKTTYYLSIPEYGFKNEMIAQTIKEEEKQSINNNINVLDNALKKQIVNTHFKDYQFLEIE